jgi:UDP-N-acetylmuramate dehydrogenase
MMTARHATPSLVDRLPRVRGRYDAMVDLGKMTWFRVGGPAEVLFAPADVEDLAAFLKTRPEEVPVTVVGLGSNMLVREGGVPGVVIHLGKPFSTITVQDTTIHCGAGAVDATVATAARDASIAGLEFLTGIPGTIGGALRMNAGAYERETKDIFISATALDGRGEVHKLNRADMGFSYRHTSVPEDWIFVGAELAGAVGDRHDITARMRAIRSEREQAQPTQARTGGSTFANPPGAKAWVLIDAAGCRGMTIGGAQVSPKHTNFLINNGHASAAEIEALGEEVRRRVKKDSDIDLTWEIQRVGVAKDDARTLAQGPMP